MIGESPTKYKITCRPKGKSYQWPVWTAEHNELWSVLHPGWRK